MTDDAGKSEILVHAIDLTKRFGADRLALDRLNFDVRAGEVYSLLGAQGSGKTTAINVFLGFLRPTDGRVLVAGLDPAAHPVQVKRRVSFMSPYVSLYETMSPRKNIQFFTRLSTGRPATRATAHEAMRQFGLPERSFDKRMDTLPAEYRLFLWLAIASLRQTPIVMLDEPTSGLDSRASADLQDHLLEFRRQGKTVLLATTDVFLASRVSDRIGMLKQGRIVAERTRGQMLGLSLNELYFEYVGRLPQNDLTGNGARAPAS